jgi:NADPH-dependent 2,4-dienoyl-CoA reductase/sulfur reductase-like enzyme
MTYYIGDVIKDEKLLIARTPEEFEKTGVTVKTRTGVEEIDPNKGKVRLNNGSNLPYDTLVLATGSNVFLPDIPGIHEEGVFKLKDLRDGIDIKTYIKEKQCGSDKCRKAIILGAGFIAMEMCEALRNLGLETSVVYRGELPIRRWDAEFSKLLLGKLTENNVEFITHRMPVAIEKKGKKPGLCLITNDGEMDADIIIFALGVKSNTALAEQIGLKIGNTGAVMVDYSQRTSREEIYAVGDCCGVYHRIKQQWVHMPLGDIANKQGRVAGANIGGHAMTFPGIVGAQSFKVFDLEVAKTGIDEWEAEQFGFHPVSTIIWGTPSARSMSKGKKLGLKMVANKSTGKLLGAQAVGEGGAVTKINTLSACLWSGMNLDEIGYIDLAYSPSFGGAWDPIQIAAQMLRKML